MRCLRAAGRVLLSSLASALCTLRTMSERALTCPGMIRRELKRYDDAIRVSVCTACCSGRQPHQAAHQGAHHASCEPSPGCDGAIYYLLLDYQIKYVIAEHNNAPRPSLLSPSPRARPQDLAFNNLTGSIPRSLTQLASIQQLDFSGNDQLGLQTGTSINLGKVGIAMAATLLPLAALIASVAAMTVYYHRSVLKPVIRAQQAAAQRAAFSTAGSSSRRPQAARSARALSGDSARALQNEAESSPRKPPAAAHSMGRRQQQQQQQQQQQRRQASWTPLSSPPV